MLGEIAIIGLVRVIKAEVGAGMKVSIGREVQGAFILYGQGSAVNEQFRNL